VSFEDLFFGDDEEPLAPVARSDDIHWLYADLQRRHEGLELLVEALVWYLEAKHGLDRAALRLMVQRLDLADGHEDRRIGPDTTASAPKCGYCGYPLNLERKACLYCGAAQPETAEPPPPRMVECVSCHGQTQEAKAFITMTGLLCSTCYAVRESGVDAGNLSLAPEEESSGALSNIDTAGALSDPDD
jgi:hypothetical protein